MNVLIIIARILVLLVALFSAGWSAVSGGILYLAVTHNDDPLSLTDPIQPDIRKEMVRSTTFLLVGAVLGFIGGILAVCGRTGSASVWLFTAGLGPVLISPAALCGSFFLFGAALLSLLAFLLTFANKPQPQPAT